MKIVKIILGIVLALVVLFLIIALIAPKDYAVSRSTTINAPHFVVWKNVSSLEKMNDWEPWSKMDPNITKTYEGEPGTVGSITRWDGDRETVGKGSQQIKMVDPMNRLETKLKFIEPWQDSSDVYIQLNQMEEGVEVTWGFSGQFPFPMNAMLLFMSMDDQIGPDFEKGLADLKEICESTKSAGTYRGFEIQLVELPIKYYITKRDTVKFAGMQQFFGANLGAIFGAATEMQYEIAGMPCGLYYTWDEQNMQADMAAAIPVTSPESKIEGFETIEIGAGKALRIDYFGSYEGSGEAHYAMEDCFKDWNIEAMEPVVEEYITDPETEPDTSKWHTQITYYVK